MALFDHFTEDMRSLTHVITSTSTNTYGENARSETESSIKGILVPKSNA